MILGHLLWFIHVNTNKLSIWHKICGVSQCNPYNKIQIIIPRIILFTFNWAESSEFVSSSIPSWQFLTAHAQPFRGARDLAFCLKVPLDSLLVWASSGGSGETARMRRLAWTFAARIGDKYQIRLARPNFNSFNHNWATSWENLFLPYANNKGADQPAHSRCLISAFVICCLDSIIPLVSISKISSP